MDHIRNLVIVSMLTVIAIGAVVYALVQDHTVFGVISASATVVLLQVLYRLYRKAVDVIPVPENAKVN